MTLQELLDSDESTVIYDGDCPFCSAYTRLIRFRESAGPIRMVNAREYPGLVHEISSAGFVLNDGMLFIFDGQMYYGNEAVQKMSLLSTDSDVFNKFNAYVFRRPHLAKATYPVMVFGRKIVLGLMGRKPL